MKNFKGQGRDMSVIATQPATPVSGDPVLWGNVPGVAVTDERADGTTTVRFYGVYELSVAAIDGGGNSPVADGDEIFYVPGDSPPLSKKNTGTLFGQAYGEITTGGATDTIQVRVAQR